MNEKPVRRRIDHVFYHGPARISALDAAEIAMSLQEQRAPQASTLLRLDVSDYVVLAVDRETRTPLAILTAADAQTQDEEFLLLHSVRAKPGVQCAGEFQRMLATLLLRLAGLSTAPSVIAACTSEAAAPAVLTAAGPRFQDSISFPTSPSAPALLSSAALARRIARALRPGRRLVFGSGVLCGAFGTMAFAGSTMATGTHAGSVSEFPVGGFIDQEERLAILDLRRGTEASVVEDARKICRRR